MTSADIAEALAEQKYEIEKRKIVLHEPLKQVGEFEVPVKIHREVTATLKVKIVPLGTAAAPAAPAGPPQA